MAHNERTLDDQLQEIDRLLMEVNDTVSPIPPRRKPKESQHHHDHKNAKPMERVEYETSPTTMLFKTPPPPKPITIEKAAEEEVSMAYSYDDDYLSFYGSPSPLPQPPSQPVSTPRKASFSAAPPPLPRIRALALKDDEDEVSYGKSDEREQKEREARRKKLARSSQILTFERINYEKSADLEALLKQLEEVDKVETQVTSPKRQAKEVISEDTSSVVRKTRKVISAERHEEDVPVIPTRKSKTTKKTKVVAVVTSSSPSPETPSPSSDDDERIGDLAKKLLNTDLEKWSQPVHYNLNHSNPYEFSGSTSMTLNSLSKAENIVKHVLNNVKLPQSEQWTLFELYRDDDVDICRPVRQFELMINVVKTWNKETFNSLLIRQHSFWNFYSIEGALSGEYERSGLLWYEKSDGTWKRRYAELKDGMLRIKNSKSKNDAPDEAVFSVEEFDAYQFIEERCRTQTSFCFALRSQKPGASKIQCFCTEDMDSLKDWVMSLRNARSRHLVESDPELMKTVIRRQEARLKLTGTRGNDQLAHNNLHHAATSLPRLRNKHSNERISPIGNKKRQSYEKIEHNDSNAYGTPNESLFNLISIKKGQMIDNGEHVNKTMFSSTSKPLVPLTVSELDGIPGIDMRKYGTPKQKVKKKKNPCSFAKCECEDFTIHRFNKKNCGNCFHSEQYHSGNR